MSPRHGYPQAYDSHWRNRLWPVKLACVQRENLAEVVGSVLSAERNRAQLSQAQLAERLGVSQQWLSRIERGRVNANLATVQRYFAALGKQLRVEAVPLQVDIDIDRVLAKAPELREREIEAHGSLLRALRDVPFAVTGHVGALAQGAPMDSPPWIDIVVAARDLDALAAIMEMSFCLRWSEKWDDWGRDPIDPRKPGAPRWKLRQSEVRLQIVDTLPPTIEVRVGEHLLCVVPIAEIERDDPWVHGLMTRWRSRARIDV